MGRGVGSHALLPSLPFPWPPSWWTPDLLPWAGAAAGLVFVLFVGLLVRLRGRPAEKQASGGSAATAEPSGDLPPIDLGGGVSISFVPIRPGAFVMGSRGYERDEEPMHEVTIAESFYAAVTPVTQAQFARWTESEAYVAWWKAEGSKLGSEDGRRHRNHFPQPGLSPPPEVEDPGTLPAERVTWYEAEAFCRWLTERLPEGRTARLPTEEEWEYFARAGSDTEYATGDGEAVLDETGWYEGNSGKRTHPVGWKAANRWGLHDCHGLVHEWTASLWCSDAYREAVPPPTDDHPRRVNRGGSWCPTAGHCRAAPRGRGGPLGRYPLQGFRVCLVPGPADAPAGTDGRSDEQRPARSGRGTRPKGGAR